MDRDKADEVERQAQTLMDAAAILQSHAEKTEEMGEDDEVDLEEAEEDLDVVVEDLQNAAEVCQALSLSQTLALMQAGQPADLNTPVEHSDDDMPSRTFH